jgi:hypothetical protein
MNSEDVVCISHVSDKGQRNQIYSNMLVKQHTVSSFYQYTSFVRNDARLLHAGIHSSAVCTHDFLVVYECVCMSIYTLIIMGSRVRGLVLLDVITLSFPEVDSCEGICIIMKINNSTLTL